MTWSEFLDLLAFIFIAWAVVAVIAGVLVGKFCKTGAGPETSDERYAADAERCCDGEFCGAWDACKKSSPLG